MIVADLLEQFPELTAQDVRSNPMGAHGEDVLLSSEAEKVVPYSFEAKNQERINLWASIDQATTNAREGRVPCVIVKRNNAKAFAIVPWSHLLELIAANVKRRKTESHISADDRAHRVLRALRAAVSVLEQEIADNAPNEDDAVQRDCM